MTTLHFRYENNRCTDDIEIAFQQPAGGRLTASFVATVPHHCASPRVFGDLFACPLDEIDVQTLPVPRGSKRELEILTSIRSYLDATVSPDEQHQFLNARFPRMSQTAADHHALLWLLRVLGERRQRDDRQLESAP